MICKVLKKGLIGAALGVGALGLIFGTAAPSYIKTAFCNARSAVKGNVPIQFEVDRLRGELDGLSAKMASHIQDVVRDEKEVAGLRDEVAVAQDRLAKEAKAIVALRGKLADGVRLTALGGGTLEDDKRILGQRFDAHVRNETIVKQKEKTLGIREQNLAAAHDQLASLKDKKDELKSRLDTIEAQLKTIEASQEVGTVTIDDSPLKALDEAVKDLESRIDSKGREAELVEQYLGDEAAAAETTAPRDVLGEIDARFGTTTGTSL